MLFPLSEYNLILKLDLCYAMHNIKTMIQRVTISLEKELVEELKSIAKKEGLSLSKFIAKSLEEYVIEKRKKEVGKKLFKIKLSKEEIEKAFEELKNIRKEETSS